MARPRLVDIRLSGAYKIDQLDRLIRDLTPILELSHPARVRIDLARTDQPLDITSVYRRLDETGDDGD